MTDVQSSRDDEVRALLALAHGRLEGDSCEPASESSARAIIERVDLAMEACPELVAQDSFLREAWMDRALYYTLVVLLVLPVVAVVAGVLALVLLPLVEQVPTITSCDVLVWQAYRRSTLYAAVSVATGLSGVALALAIPALCAPFCRRARIRLAVLTVALLLVSSVTGAKEQRVRSQLGEIASRSASGSAPVQMCQSAFREARVLYR